MADTFKLEIVTPEKKVVDTAAEEVQVRAKGIVEAVLGHDDVVVVGRVERHGRRVLRRVALRVRQLVVAARHRELRFARREALDRRGWDGEIVLGGEVVEVVSGEDAEALGLP